MCPDARGATLAARRARRGREAPILGSSAKAERLVAYVLQTRVLRATILSVAFRPRYERTRCIPWTFERAGWIAMAALCAGAGLGGRLLSDAEATAGDELTVKYPRFARAHAPIDLAVDWLPRQQEASLWISRAFLDGFEIAEIRPAPSTVTIGHDRIHYTFRTSEPSARVGVTFRLKPEHGGAFSGPRRLRRRSRRRDSAVRVPVTEDFGRHAWIS
jgi:hypothetical protein